MIPARKQRRKKGYQGSLTVEAAFVFPIFIYAIAIFLYLFQMIYIQQNIQRALHYTAGYFTSNAYLFDQICEECSEITESEKAKVLEKYGIDKILTGQMYKAVFRRYIEDEVVSPYLIQGGMHGITIRAQSDYYDDQEVDLCAFYEFKIPVLFFKIQNFDCVQRVHADNWVGQDAKKLYGEKKEEEEPKQEDDEIVYYTLNGTKYHTSRECHYLKLSIQETLFENMKTMRNMYHAKYTPCEICAKNKKFQNSDIVIFSDQGNRYHSTRNCSGITRYVQEIKKSELDPQYTLCSKCRKRDEKAQREKKEEKDARNNNNDLFWCVECRGYQDKANTKVASHYRRNDDSVQPHDMLKSSTYLSRSWRTNWARFYWNQSLIKRRDWAS